MVQFIERRFRTALLYAGVLVLAGCSAAPASSVGPSKPVEPTSTPPVESVQPVEQPSPAGADVPAPTAPSAPETTAAPPLPAAGDEWILFVLSAGYSTWDELWAVYPDGSGLTSLSGQGYVGPRDDLLAALQPGGTRLAMITQKPGDAPWEDLALRVVDLATGRQEAAIALTSPETAPRPNEDDFMRLDAVRSIAEIDSLTWSPDGSLLAFLGAQQGTSSDLYTYDPLSGTVNRLTDGPTEGLRPAWSPDGAYILHSGVTTLGTGAGLGMDRVWAARADGSGVIEMYEALQSGDENWLGWADARTPIIVSWDAGCGYKDIRTQNIETGEGRFLWTEYASDAAFSPELGLLLVSVDEWVSDCNDTYKQGLYLVDVRGGAPRLVSEAPAYLTNWEPAFSRFVAGVGDGGRMLVAPDGSTTVLEGPGFAFTWFSPDGATIAWTVGAGPGDSTPGAWIGTVGGAIFQITDMLVTRAVWSPDGSRLALFAEDGVYAAAAPDFNPIRIVDGEAYGLQAHSAVWIAR